MALLKIEKQLSRAILLFLFCGVAFQASAQVTRGQLLTKFYKASTYHNAGNDEKAIEIYNEIATLAPMYPDTYLRIAEIYDKANNVEAALLMYRKYINLELDDAKVEEPSKRLKELESQLGVKHYEDIEAEQTVQLYAKYNVVQQEPQSQNKAGNADKSNNLALKLFADDKTEQEETVEADEAVEMEVEASEDAVHEEPALNEAPVKKQGLTLFSMAALVETRNEVALEEEQEAGAEDDVVAEDTIVDDYLERANLVSSKIDGNVVSIEDGLVQNVPGGQSVAMEDKIELDNDFLEKVRLQSAPAKSADVVVGGKEQPADYPLLTYMKKDRLSQYRIVPSAFDGTLPVSANGMDISSILSGKWVSSECNGNGREIWMFDISQAGATWYVSLNDASGVYLKEEEGVVDASWHAIKSVFAYDHSMSNRIKELKEKTVSVKVDNNVLSYTFVSEHQHKPNKTVYTWSRNILEGVSGIIPFGGLVSQVGNTLINYVSEKDLQKTYTTTMQFYVKAVTPNVLSCDYVVSEKERSSEGEKEIYKERKNCLFYKAGANYNGFNFVSDNETNLYNMKLYKLLKADAEIDNKKLYPLAYMAYSGAGTKRSMSKAIGAMQTLADKDGSRRAKAWLVPMYYNLSNDVEAYPLRTSRKNFRKCADDLLGDLLVSGYPYAYSLQADIYVSNNPSDSQALPLYQKAAELGDVYALYKLGMIYVEGQLDNRDVAKAMAYFEEAGKKGYADAYLQLALLYRYGKLVERNYKKYTEYLLLAVNDGSVDALKEMSSAYYLGLGVEDDFETANRMKELYMKAACDEWKEILTLYGYNTNM